jgi:UDP-glucose 4-epimerase
MTDETYLVTGGAGFIGSHLVDALLARGKSVRVLDNFSTGRRENLAHVSGDIELIEGDLRSYERVHRAVVGCDVVLHLGALPSVPRSIQDPLTTNAVNVTGTLNVLLASRDAGVRRAVIASSSSVYGPTKVLPKTEEMEPRPASPYGVSKLAAEQYFVACHSVYDIESVALRLFNVFGPRQDPTSQYSAVVPLFIDAALRGTRPTIFGDGSQSRDFTYVANVVDAFQLAATSEKAAGQVMNVACGDQRTLNDLVQKVSEAAHKSLDPVYAEPRIGDIAHSLADISKARLLLGYAPSVGFEDGVARTVEWMRDR